MCVLCIEFKPEITEVPQSWESVKGFLTPKCGTYSCLNPQPEGWGVIMVVSMVNGADST